MAYRRIEYLEWARTFMGNVRHDLARSNVRGITKEELGLTLDQVRIDIVDERGLPELRKHLAERYKIDPACILVTNGATSAIALACAATMQVGDEVIVEAPNYEPLYRNPINCGATTKMLERTFEHAWQIDLEEFQRRISRRTRAVLITNAHNPSGAATSPEKMMTIGQIARENGARVIVCETYLDNLFKGRPVSCIGQGDNFIAIGTVSKVVGLGGLRIGWMAAEEGVIARATAAADYIAGGVSTPSQSIALHALQQSDRLVDRCRKIVQSNVKILADWIRRRPELAWIEPDAGTVALLKLPAHMDAMRLSNHLREKYSTLVVPGDFFWIKGFVRVSLGIEEDTLKAGLKNLAAAIDELKPTR